MPAPPPPAPPCERAARPQSPTPPSSIPARPSFTVTASGQQLLYVNTHFDHESEDARTKAAQALLKQLPALSNGVPVVVSGGPPALRCVGWPRPGPPRRRHTQPGL